jgi:hypothetical protein
MRPVVITGRVGHRGARAVVREARTGVAWPAVLGCAALLLGVLVYLTDRDTSRTLLIPGVPALAASHWFGTVGQWLPSAIHPFAFSLLSAAALPAPRSRAYGACLVWCVVNVVFEMGQHPLISAPLAQALDAAFGRGPIGGALARYFVRGTFDVGDIVAAVAGALAAAAVVHFGPRFARVDHAD